MTGATHRPRIGLIGFGSIGRAVFERLGARARFCALTRSEIMDAPDGLTRVDALDALLAFAPDVVVECAGHGAVRTHAAAVLEAGVPLVVASLGALADAALHQTMTAAATRSGAPLVLTSGAIGGLDLLRALAGEGPVEVTYIGTKPPAAWKGSVAEQAVDLDAVTQATTIFTGTGRDAATAYPKNANVVAALALAGAGFDRLRVTLVADPEATANTHAYTVHADAACYNITITNAPSKGNSRTSLTTVLSLVSDIRALIA